MSLWAILDETMPARLWLSGCAAGLYWPAACTSGSGSVMRIPSERVWSAQGGVSSCRAVEALPSTVRG